MLRSIIAVTIAAPELDALESAYVRFLDYRVVERGRIGPALAAAWGAPAAAGRSCVVLQPASGEPVFLRAVQCAPTPGYGPLRTHGWNANEILVADPDALAERLATSPFRIIGAPRPLQINPAVRAMQVIGPAEELCYLTCIPPGASAFALGSARSFVDRTFIAVLGGPDMQRMRAFYADVLGLPVTEPASTAIHVLQAALGLPAEALTLLAIARLPERFLIELDEYPPQALPRPRRPDDLPPGIAMVTFGVESLEPVRAAFVAAPARGAGLLYGGRRTALLHGAAGEWIELLETGARRTRRYAARG